ncbi:MAG TPA: hypothetical protein VNB90_16660 [Cytophagaceae bacterium]|nr:hypothetical protein [Cytophagaceae bacterium]
MRIYIFICLVLLSINLPAQVTDSLSDFAMPSVRMRGTVSPFSYYRSVEARMDQNYYTIEKQGKYFVLYRYDSLLVRRASRRLMLSDRQLLYSLFAAKGKLGLITSEISFVGADRKNTLQLQYLHPQTLIQMGNSIMLEEFSYKRNFSNTSLYSLFSRDSSRLAIVSSVANKEGAMLHVQVYDANMNLLWERNELINISKKVNWKIKIYRVSFKNGKDVMIAVKIPAMRSKLYKEYRCYTFTNDGQTVYSDQFSLPKSQRMHMQDLGLEKNSERYFIFEYPTAWRNDSVTYERVANARHTEKKLFSVEEYLGSDSLKKVYNNNPNNYIMTDIVPVRDSARIFIFEYQDEWHSRYHSTYLYGPLLLIKTNKDGQVVWHRSINKSQHQLDSKNKLSYQYIYLNNKDLYLVYNQDKSKPSRYQTSSEGYYNCITKISDAGIVQQRVLFDSSYYSLCPSESAVLDNKMLFHATHVRDSSKYTSYLIELDFNKLQPVSAVAYDHSPEDSSIIEQSSLRKQKDMYFGFSLGYGSNYYRPISNGTATVNFPYTEVGSTLIQRQAIFSKDYRPMTLSMLCLSTDFVYGKGYGEGGVLINISNSNTNNSMLYLGGGLNYRIPKTPFRLRAGARFTNTLLENVIGELSNKNLLIINNDDKFSSSGQTTKLWVMQHELGLSPILGAECWIKRKIIMRASAAYNFAFTHQARLDFKQTTDNGHEAKYHLDEPFLNYRYNGIPTNRGPYSTNGFMFSVQVVYNLNLKKYADARNKRI